MGHNHHPSIVLPLSLTIIFGSFTLGFYVAIQGPTLMDLIDLLHVNNDIMSHSLAVASLAYSVGGLLSGLLFNYVDRQILIPGYYIVFGLSNICTPYITNYYIFSVVTVFKMMCAGGTDCGANVWILDMWPGKDAWLQALHFSFAVGCALGPLVVEPFLSAGEHKEGQGVEVSFTQGTALISNENTESRIWIPYGVSGSASLLAAFLIVYFYFLESKRKRADELAAAVARGDSPLCPLTSTSAHHQHQHHQQNHQHQQHQLQQLKQLQGASPEHIRMSPVQHAAAIEAGLANASGGRASPAHSVHASAALSVPDTIPEEGVPLRQAESPEASPQTVRRRNTGAATPSPPDAAPQPNATNATSGQIDERQHDDRRASPSPDDHLQLDRKQQQQQQDIEAQEPGGLELRASSNSNLNQSATAIVNMNSSQTAIQVAPGGQAQSQSQSKPSLQLADFDQVKFTSKAKEGDGRPPYYVMLAIALSALCLSFYCGIEITSMNYLATFAVNIDLQLPKSSAALMSSALTISFAVGRLFGIWIAAYMRPHKLFYLCSAVMALGNVFILLFANTAEMLLWASVCLFGIGCGPMYASIVSFYDDKISKVTNTVSGIFILGSMFNVALNTLIIGHYIIDNALILIVCNLIGAVLLLCLFGSLHALTRVKKNQRKRKFKLQQLKAARGKPGAGPVSLSGVTSPNPNPITNSITNPSPSPSPSPNANVDTTANATATATATANAIATANTNSNAPATGLPCSSVV